MRPNLLSLVEDCSVHVSSVICLCLICIVLVADATLALWMIRCTDYFLGCRYTQMCMKVRSKFQGCELSTMAAACRFWGEICAVHAACRYVGYDEGGVLTEAVRQKPYSVVLFDEFEKADQSISNVSISALFA